MLYLVDGTEGLGVNDQEVGLLLWPIKSDGDEGPVILGLAARPGQEVHLRHVVILLVQHLAHHQLELARHSNQP